MAPFPVFLALRYLRPKRSFASAIPVITTCGVMLGVAILMIVLAVMTGFGDVWREKILSFKPHLTVYACAKIGDRKAVLDEIPDAEAVADAATNGVSGVKSAAPAILFPAMLRNDRTGGDPVTVMVLGVDPDRPTIVGNAADHMAEGTFDVREDRAVMGIELARRLGARPGTKLLCYSPLNLKSRDELYFPEEVETAGVYDMGMRDFDNGILLCSLGMARALMGMDEGARMVHVQLDDPEAAGEVAPRLEAVLEARFPGRAFEAVTWMEEDQVLFNALYTEKTMMFILLAFIGVVAAFCVMNTLIVITIQKTKEIGLLKALGFSGGSIRAAFVLNGMAQCVVGEALGLALGALVLHNLQRLVDLMTSLGWEVFPKAVYGLPEIPRRIVGTDVAAVLGVVFGLCLLASFLPAWLASRLDPVKAINQE